MAEERTGKPTLDELNAKLAGRIVVDPASIAGDAPSGSVTGDDAGAGERGRNKDGSARRKPGRKPGSGGASKTKVSSRVGLEKLLYSAHLMAAKWIPELALEHSESQMLADAIDDVQQFYGYEASAEALLWMNVMGVLSGVYGTRIAAYTMNKKMRKLQPAPQREKPVPSPVPNASPFVNVEGFDLSHHAPDE